MATYQNQTAAASATTIRINDPIYDVQQAMQAVHKRASETQTKQSYYVLLSIWPHHGTEIHWEPKSRSLHWADVRITTIKDIPNYDYSLGYTFYKQRHVSPPTKGLKDLTAFQWDQQFASAVTSINNAVRTYHGISFRSVFQNENQQLCNRILHFCDYITIMKCRLCNLSPPSVFIGSDRSTHHYMEPHQTGIDDQQRRFILINADFFYLCYGLWQNNSRLPITYHPNAQHMPKAIH